MGPLTARAAGAVAAGVERAGRVMAGQPGHQRVDLGEQDVGVHVHGGRRHGSSRSIVMVRAMSPGTSASRAPSSCHCPSCTDAFTTGRTRVIRRS